MKPTTIALLQKCKQEKKRFATITAYDHSFAKLFADEGINVLLVGDSLGMTVQGHDSTLPVTVEDIAYHTRAVRRGAPNSLLLADLPFMAYATPRADLCKCRHRDARWRQYGQTRGRRPAGRHREDAGGARGAGLRPSWPDAAVGERIRWV